jgi:hypothetical protein
VGRRGRSRGPARLLIRNRPSWVAAGQDGSGNYSFTGLQSSGFTVNVSANGYVSSSKDVTLTSNQTLLFTLTRVPTTPTPTPSPTPSPSCDYTLSVGSTIDGYPNGGSFSVTVTTTTGCTWTAVSSVSWMHVSGSGSGSGTGTFTFTVDANPGSARTGTLTIAGKTVTFNQAASTPTPTPAPTPGPTPSPGPTTGRLAISTTASQGWTSITVTINGQVAGTLTRYLEPGNPASCDAVAGARVMAVVPAGNVSYSALTESGGTWSGSAQVSANGCSEIVLTCSNRDCRPAPTPTPTPPPPPTIGPYYVWGGTNYAQYLGSFSCAFCSDFSTESINNQFSLYGSQFSTTSIRNQFSLYGSQFSNDSACNQFASNPPRVYNSNRSVIYGELTINQFRPAAIGSLFSWLQTDVCRH